MTEEEMIEACKKACIHDDVKKMQILSSLLMRGRFWLATPIQSCFKAVINIECSAKGKPDFDVLVANVFYTQYLKDCQHGYISYLEHINVFVIYIV